MKHGNVIDPRRDGTRRHIWLCADDYGMSPAVNVAIRDLVVRGRINATSVMVIAPNFYRSEAVSLNILNARETRVAIGLHLTLTAPYQPLSRNFQPVRDGIFLSQREMARHSFLHRLQREVMEIEISSQLQEFIAAFGRLPDFIDGHQHVHLFPQIREALLRVVKDVAPNVWVRQCGRIGPLHKRLADGKAIALDVLSSGFRRLANRYGVRVNPAFAGTYGFAKDADYIQIFPRFLRGLPDGSVVMCHPGFVDAELQRLDPLTTLREREYLFLIGNSLPGLLDAHGVTLLPLPSTNS
jgi:chitin disaccharide deacetylase